MAFWPFQSRKRIARDAAFEVMASEDESGPVVESAGVVVFLWAVRLLLWLLAKYPKLWSIVFDRQRKVAEQMFGSDRDACLAAVTALQHNFPNYPTLTKQVMEARP